MNTSSIRNHHASMAYRRFGRTDRWLSVITLGGMRYHEGWGEPRDQPSSKMIDQCADITRRALDAGINHIETAYGYGKSEHCYGIALNEVLKVPRQQYHLMTKGNPQSAEETRELVDKQLTALNTDHIDLYGWHGINTHEIREIACAPGGPVEELRKMQEEGIIGNVGFSTHGPYDVLIDSLHSGLFDFINLHYYYFLQRNRGVVDYAGSKDIGVFIISPNDKGGRLFEPSEKLTQLCAPLTPIQFNAKWCLANPQIHTLSFGLSEAEQFTEMQGIFPVRCPLTADELAIAQRMDNAILADPEAAYDGYEIINDPSGINIPEVLRQRRMWHCYDQEAFGYYRYNMFQDKGHWFPGCFATPEAVDKVDIGASPAGCDVRAMLNETHEKFFKPKE